MLDSYGNQTASVDSGLHSGAAIVNAKGVPGTLGCLAITLHDRRLVLATSHHVLFGGGAGEHDRVWLVRGTHEQRSFACAGRAGYGRAGTVRHGDGTVHVDCAVAELDSQAVSPGSRIVEDAASDLPPLAPGDLVTKTGAATGSTHGVVVDVDYVARLLVAGKWHEAPGQILVRSAARGSPFSAEGDSGAVLRNECGAVVGLLWGANTRGDGIACPIAPVLYVLNIRLARVLPSPGDRVSPASEVS